MNNPFQINTSITPSPIYSPTQTQYAKNQAKAAQAQYMDPSAAVHMAGLDKPGVSRSAGTYARVMPGIANAASQANAANTQIPFQFDAANAQNNLAGQMARDAEFSGLAGVQMGRMGAGQQQQQSQLQILFQLLGGTL